MATSAAPVWCSVQLTTFTLDDDLAECARALGINVSAAPRQGVTGAEWDAATMRAVCAAATYAFGC